MRHIIAVQLQNEAGALTRLAGLFASRGYNIESLSVAATNDPTLSRLTLVTTGDESAITQLLAQIQKLIDVVMVTDLTDGQHIERELLIIRLKVSPNGLESLQQLTQEHGARVLAQEPDNFVIELPQSEADVNLFIAAVSRYGVIREVVRSGALALATTGMADG